MTIATDRGQHRRSRLTANAEHLAHEPTAVSLHKVDLLQLVASRNPLDQAAVAVFDHHAVMPETQLDGGHAGSGLLQLTGFGEAVVTRLEHVPVRLGPSQALELLAAAAARRQHQGL